jgi:hypothetical protein
MTCAETKPKIRRGLVEAPGIEGGFCGYVLVWPRELSCEIIEENARCRDGYGKAGWVFPVHDCSRAENKGVEYLSEDRVAIPDQVLQGPRVRKRLDDLLRGPGRAWIRCHVEVHHASAIVLRSARFSSAKSLRICKQARAARAKASKVLSMTEGAA